MPKQPKRATIAQPNPNSKRTARRAKRNFKGLEASSRKHRRAARRSLEVRNISGTVYDAGVKQDTDMRRGGKLKASMHNAGGSMKYHKM